MFAEEQVLAAHDAAHELRSHDLHNLAMRLMDLCGIEHISLDDFDPDPYRTGDTWFEAAGCVLVKEDALVQVGPWEPKDGPLHLFGRTAGNSTWWTETGLINRITGFDSRTRSHIIDHDPEGIQSPLYDLWLVKKEERDIVNTGGLVPTQRVEVGPFREFGRYKFPVVAQEIRGERCELHKTGDKCVVLGLDERPTEVEEAMHSIDVPIGIWLGMYDGETMWVYDCLLYAYEQSHEKPLSHRLRLLPDAVGALRPLEDTLLEDPAALLTLPEGRYLIRWAEEVPDLEEPFWFIHEAQRIRVGQPFASIQWSFESVECDSPVWCILPDGLRTQLHVDSGSVSIFTDGKTWNVSAHLGQVSEAASVLRCESAVFDGLLLWQGATGRDIAVALNRGEDLSDEDVKFLVMDCLYLDSSDIHNLKCSDRLERASSVINEGSDHLRMTHWGGPPSKRCLKRNGSSTYPLDGSNPGWYVEGDTDEDGRLQGQVDDDQGTQSKDAQEDRQDETQVDQRTLSRQWVEHDGERVTQDTVPVAMSYQHRHHGMLSDDQVRSAWNELQGPEARRFWKEYGLASLKIGIDELREQYQAADWRKRSLVLSKAIDRRFPRDLDLTRVVKPVTVDGQLVLISPADESMSLGMTNDVVQASLQFITSEGRIEDLAGDLLLAGTNDLFVAHQDAAMEVGNTGPTGPSSSSSIYDIAAFGKAILGVQKHDFHEVFLLFDGDLPSGRFVWSYVDVNGDMIWLGRRPDEQAPYIFTHDMDEEVEKARIDSGWIAWNPDGIRALADSTIKASLPVNWEERLDPYDDSPFVDFS